MPERFLAFLNSRSKLTEEQIAEQLPDLRQEISHLNLSDSCLTPLQPLNVQAAPEDGQLPHECPQGYQLFAKTMEALKERYPFRGAVLEFKTLLRLILVGCEAKGLVQLSDEDYAMILCLLDGMDKLTERCLNCPVCSSPFEASTVTQ